MLLAFLLTGFSLGCLFPPFLGSPLLGNSLVLLLLGSSLHLCPLGSVLLALPLTLGFVLLVAAVLNGGRHMTPFHNVGVPFLGLVKLVPCMCTLGTALQPAVALRSTLNVRESNTGFRVLADDDTLQQRLALHRCARQVVLVGDESKLGRLKPAFHSRLRYLAPRNDICVPPLTKRVARMFGECTALQPAITLDRTLLVRESNTAFRVLADADALRQTLALHRCARQVVLVGDEAKLGGLEATVRSDWSWWQLWS